MPYTIETISVSRLLLDEANARLGEVQPDQRSTEIALAQLLGLQLLEIAQDIVSEGLDPSALLIVTPEGASARKYRVIEGNRRVLALKSLTDPAIVHDPLGISARRKRLADLSAKFKENPIVKVRCVVFDREVEATHWITLRHTGENGGVGLVGWDSNEQDRYRSRHSSTGKRSAAGQIIDFVDSFDPPLAGQNSGFITTLDRLISTPAVRLALGIEVERGVVYSHFPADEVIKGLLRVVRDLRSGEIKVKDVFYLDDRLEYIQEFEAESLPAQGNRLASRVVLSDLDNDKVATGEVLHGSSGGKGGRQTGGSASSQSSNGGSGATAASNDASGNSDRSADSSSASPARRSRAKAKAPRATLIPRSCVLWIKSGRINDLYHELLNLDVNQFTNSGAVALRVFLELTVDHHMVENSLLTEQQLMSDSLAKKLRELADFLHSSGRIDIQLKRAVHKIADGGGRFSASTVTFNQYVHNAFAYPSPTELRTAWDELEPFMQILWKK